MTFKYLKETDKTFVIYWITQNRIMMNWIFFNLTEDKQIFTNVWKTESNFWLFPILHCILPYLSTNIPFKFCSMGLVLMRNDDENDKVSI